MRRAAWFALAGALWLAAPASAQEKMYADDDMVCYTDDTAEECAKKHYTHLEVISGKLLQTWKNKWFFPLSGG